MERKKDWRKLLLAPVLFCSVALSQAQVTLSAMVPGGGVYLKPQLWNLTVANTGRATLNAQVRMEMRDLQTHATVLSAVSARFPLPPGASVLQERSLQPVQYSSGPGGPPDLSPNGVLPIGSFQVCYQLFVVTQEGMEPAADDCIQLGVEPLSPPLLAIPEDSARVGTPTPAFTWVPPAPLSMFGNLNYDFLLTEVYPGQSATDALQRNLPIQQASGLLQPFLQYPLQSVPLDTAKLYAWQVTARDGPRYAARSEAWVFRLKVDTAKTAAGSSPFVKLSDRALAPAMITGGKLRIEYDHALGDSTVQATITGNGQDAGRPIKFKLKVRYGQNFIEYDLGGTRLAEDKIYELRLVDSRGNVRYMRFIPQTLTN